MDIMQIMNVPSDEVEYFAFMLIAVSLLFAAGGISAITYMILTVLSWFKRK